MKYLLQFDIDGEKYFEESCYEKDDLALLETYYAQLFPTA